MKKVFSVVFAVVATAFCLTSCGGSSAESSDYEFVDSILTYKDEPVAVITKVKQSMQEMELESGNVTFSEERPIMRVSFRLLKQLDSKGIYATMSIKGIDQDDSAVKNASWSLYDSTQEHKLGEFFNQNVGDTITIKFANKKNEAHIDFHLDQIKKMTVDYFSVYTKADSDKYYRTYGLPISDEEDED